MVVTLASIAIYLLAQLIEGLVLARFGDGRSRTSATAARAS